MENLNNEDEALEHLKDLLVRLNPIIKMSGNSEAMKELLLHLSELYPLFHQLKMVKGLRKNLRDNLSIEVESAVEKYLLENKGKTRAEPPVEHLVNLISQNNSFTALISEYITDLDNNINYVWQCGENSFFKEILENDILNNKESPINSTEHSLNSSLNQSGFLFLHPAQYNIIAQNLLRKDTIEGFHDALNMLLVVTPGEPVSQDSWGSIKKILKKLLLDTDEAVFNKVLRIHTRLLASQVHSVVLEGYTNLIEAIATVWLSRKQFKSLPDVNQGISLKNSKVIMLISVLLKFVKEFALVWVRYPSKYMIEVIDQTLSLFVTSISPGKMSALDILSIVDPKAKWIHCWMFGCLGRQKVCEALSSKLSLVFSLLSNCISYLENNQGSKFEGPFKSRFSSHEVRFLIFSHSFHFVMKLFHYIDGVALFPIVDPATLQHISVKKFMNILQIPFVNGNRILIFAILDHLTEICYSNETVCRLLCDSGFTDFLATTIHYNDISQSNIWYYELVLEFFLSLNNTTVGHKYILLGTLQRISLATLITNHDEAIGRHLCGLAENLLINNISPLLVKKAVKLCLEILFSPLGKYLYFNHSMMSTVITVLKRDMEKCESFDSMSTLILEDPALLMILKALIHCFEGVIFLDRNIVLDSVLRHLIPHFAEKGQIKIRLLNSVTSSQKGAKLLAELSAIKPFWGMVNLIIEKEVTNKVMSLEEDREQLFSKAILPLMCLSTSYEGTVQLFGENGIFNSLTNFLDELSQDDDAQKIIYYLLCSATSTLDKMIFMQKTFDVQKKLVAIESRNVDESGISYISEYSVMANHIILWCTLPKGLKSHLTPIFADVIDEYTVADAVEDPVVTTNRGDTTRSKDIWKFLNNPESRTQEASGIMHCRRTYRLEIAANSFFKISTFLDIIDFTIANFANSSDELFPENLMVNFDSTLLDNDCENCRPTDSDCSRQSSENLQSDSDLQTCNCSSFKFAVEFMVRYAVEVKLLPENSAQMFNALKFIRTVQANLLSNSYPKTDWFSLLLYIMSGGWAERTYNIMENLRTLRVGAIIWPALYPSLVKVKPPHSMLYSGVIQAVKLLLYRDAPDIYVSYEVLTYL